MKDLIDLERCKRNIQSVTDNTQDALLGVLISAVSDAVRKYCRRDFHLRSYDELYNGNGDRRLLLRQYPIASVDSVRYRPVTVLKIQNSDQATNQQARVTVTATGLTLVRVASGVKTTDTSITWSANSTLTAVASAVNALGNGWQAQVVGDSPDYALWPSVDLYWPPSFGDGTTAQGALTARGTFAELKMHTFELQGYQWDARGWLLRAIPYTDPELLHPEDLIWPIGINNFRVQYTAGYATIPEAVQEAVAEWVAMMYFQTLRDPSLGSQVSGGVGQGWATGERGTILLPPDSVAILLAPYRRFSIATIQG
jgi:hypothetical protein